jgi:uncharacterized protein (TIGR00369 family)
MSTFTEPDSPSLVARRTSLPALEHFRRMIAGLVPQAPMVELLGMRMVEADEGRVVFTAEPSEAYYNGMGVVHGGYLATLLDSALGCAINTRMAAGTHFTTLELKINYTRPVSAGVGTLRCEATVIHVGARVGTAEARVVDARGKLYAHATTTCIAVESSPRNA